MSTTTATKTIEKLSTEAQADYRDMVFDIVASKPIDSEKARLILFAAGKSHENLVADVSRLEARKAAAAFLEAYPQVEKRRAELNAKIRDAKATIREIEAKHRQEVDELKGRHQAEVAKAERPLAAIDSERQELPVSFELSQQRKLLVDGCSEKTRARIGAIQSSIDAIGLQAGRFRKAINGHQEPNPNFQTENDDRYIMRNRRYLEPFIAALETELAKPGNGEPYNPFSPDHALEAKRKRLRRAKRDLVKIADAEQQLAELDLRPLREKLAELEPLQFRFEDVDL